MTRSEELADFAVRATYEDLSGPAREALRIRVLDSLGCAIGALGSEPVRLVRQQVEEFGGAPLCTLIGGGKTAPDRAAFYNGALVRYLDFNDSYLAKGETCHPSDNVAAVLAAAEYANRSGREFMIALAVAYQVQCRLSDVAPVRDKGFDHTTQGSYAVAAGVSRALGLDRTRAANALNICGTAFNALRVTRTGRLSHWKGLAYPNAAFCCTHAAFLAMRGISGPPEVFEGNKGFMQTIAGPFELDWSREGVERVTRTILKNYNAEIHSQSAIEALLELKQQERIRPEDVERIELDTFDVAYKIIGGGEEGDKRLVATKEEADHSLPYLLAVALLDGEVMPEQFAPDRIRREDVQQLMRKVVVRPSENLSRRFPSEMPAELRIILRGGRTLEARKAGYEGFLTTPMSWAAAVRKFERLAVPQPAFRRPEIVDAVASLDSIQVSDLMRLLQGEPTP